MKRRIGRRVKQNVTKRRGEEIRGKQLFGRLKSKSSDANQLASPHEAISIPLRPCALRSYKPLNPSKAQRFFFGRDSPCVNSRTVSVPFRRVRHGYVSDLTRRGPAWSLSRVLPNYFGAAVQEVGVRLTYDSRKNKLQP